MKPRGVLIAGNWKMNHGPQATEEFFAHLRAREGVLSAPTRSALKTGSLRAQLYVPNVSLVAASGAAAGVPVQIGAQNAHWEKGGAFTGETSGPMLLELGIRSVLVAHSERRQFFGETDETARKRTESLLEQGFEVVLCIGETRSQREAGETESTLLEQLQAVLREPGQGASRFLNGKLILAYEPVWAIGTGLTATPDQAEQAHQVIRKYLWDRFGMDAAAKTPILYGGSVTSENVSSLLACPNIDGGLVGGASIKAESFLKLLDAGGQALHSAD